MSPLFADFLFILLTLATIAGLVALAIGFDRLGRSDSRSAPAAASSSTASAATDTVASSADGRAATDTVVRATPTTDPGDRS